METPRKVRRTVLIVLALLADVLLILIWAIRPPLQFGKWLVMGRGDEAPIRVLSRWLRGAAGPWTPFGLFSGFEPADLVAAAALLFVFSVLVTLLAMSWLGMSPRLLDRLQTRISWRPSMKVGVRATMFAVALVGLWLGWEVNAWETWRLRQAYLQRFYDVVDREDRSRDGVTRLRSAIEKTSTSASLWGDPTFTPEASNAARAEYADRQTLELAEAEIRAQYYAKLVRKYTYAVANPREPVERDPPLPVQPDITQMLARGEYKQALDFFDNQIRRYPALPGAHYWRARILATCPDARIRDGNEAILSATRACELTTWMYEDNLQVLAAAYAEAGDFTAAVEWQKKALGRMGPRWFGTGEAQDRLALYQSRKPFRQKY